MSGDEYRPGSIGMVVVGGDDDSESDDLLESFYADHYAKLLNAPFGSGFEQVSFAESFVAPPAFCHADFEDRRYPVLRRDGTMDRLYLWGSNQLAAEELPADDPTRRILNKLAQKHHVGVYSQQWQSPTPEFLLQKQAAVGVVKRYRENYAPKPLPTISETLGITTESAASTYKPTRISVAFMEDYPAALLRELRTIQRSLPSAGQRLGLQQAIRLVESGVHVSPK